jgi:PPOX class probable FMN-dependent enzyme
MSNYLASWRSPLQRALHRNRSQIFSRYFQLATISPKGFPTNRTVVFRGFLDGTNYLKIITDTRSEKLIHLQQNPLAEICWYFAKTREQFRIRGKIELITEKNQEFNHWREETWQQLSDNAKQQFYWPHPGKTLTETSQEKDFTFDDEKPVNNFCLLLFNPQRVDHLELRHNPHHRHLYLLDLQNQWFVEKINP